MKDYIRNLLAIIWSLAAIGMLTYILVKYGDQKEILTLVIGIIGGTIVGGVFGFYFSASHNSKPQINETPKHEVTDFGKQDITA